MINQDLLAWARSYIGTSEVIGDVNNPIIMEWARILGVTHYTNDDREWCGLAMAFFAHVCGAEKPSSFLLARNWLSVGAPVLRPIPGDVVVFWRGAPDGFDGHVALYEGEDAASIWTLGGNQIDSVRQYFYPRERVLGYRRLWRASP